MELTYILVLISFVVALIGIIYANVNARIKSLEKTTTAHESRIQKSEDVQGLKMDNLNIEFKEFKKEVRDKFDVLTAMVHKEKNQENQINQTLKLLLEKLTERND